MASRFQNLYVARLTTQERPCFVCSKFTSVVLTSADNSNDDWLYVCRSHLGDTNFCDKLGGRSPQPVSPRLKKTNLQDRPPESDSVGDLVASIGSVWKNWRGTKEENKEEEKKEEKKEEKVEEEVPPTTTSSPTPIRFVLQKDYFYLRQREYIKKNEKRQAKERLAGLSFPEVPKQRPGA
ncbi:AAA-ATPase Vps4-associated protein 1-domain-containing protein [Phycomyces nitens]|nr:AAA-ATPase Vps4-associated protein 1-domain-containing protein [Phycomyces nitens]